MNNHTLWEKSLKKLENEVEQNDFNTWLRPLMVGADAYKLRLNAPNRFVKDWVEDNLFETITNAVQHFSGNDQEIIIDLENHFDEQQIKEDNVFSISDANYSAHQATQGENKASDPPFGTNRLNTSFTFENHVEGKSNQIARAAAKQVGENPGSAYNPLFIYGGVGLGKTHLMHAAGNLIRKKKSSGKISVAYVHSERFVSDFVKALGNNTMNQFKQFYRSLDGLLIDDIQFFAGKNQSQEEFFHTYNTLLEIGSQIILTSDRFPKEIVDMDERLISRFESGLTVRIDPPELETRVAILNNKAALRGFELDEDVAFMVAKKIRSNVRELEGALHRLVACAKFTGSKINLDLAKYTLQDHVMFQERKISIENIQKTVADFFGIRLSELKGKRRNRQFARPRQISMALAKELTSLSLPDIGDAFGGRDHTTVMHACKKISELCKTDAKVSEDYSKLMKMLST